jgi:hypothetical protein
VVEEGQPGVELGAGALVEAQLDLDAGFARFAQQAGGGSVGHGGESGRWMGF